MSNNECRMSKGCILSILKRLSKAKPPFDILRFDIRYSAVRCSGYLKFHTRCQGSGLIVSKNSLTPEH